MLRAISKGIELDCDPSLSISLNYSLNDIFDLPSRQTNYSKTVIFPGTEINNKYFNFYFDTAVGGVNVNKLTPIQLLTDDTTIFRGFIHLEKVIVVNEDYCEYECQLIGIFNNMINKMGDHTLSVLNFSEFNHIRSRSNIINTYDYIIHKNGSQLDVGAPGYGYIYPYIIYGANTDIFYNSYISDLYPGIYLKTYIDKIFEFLGLTYTSRILNTVLFSKLYLPYVGEKVQKSDEQISLETTRVGVNNAVEYVQIVPFRGLGTGWWKNFIDSDGSINLTREDGEVDDVTGELTFQDPQSSFTGGKYTCQQTGYYNITFSGKLIALYYHVNGNNIEFTGSGSFNYYYRLWKNGTIIDSSFTIPITFQPSAGSHPSPWYDIDNPLDFSLSATNILLEAGDVIKVEYGFQYTSTNINWDGIDNNVFIGLTLKKSLGDDFTKFIVEPADNSDLGNTELNMNVMVPDMKMSELFLDIVNMFNLVIVDDPNDSNNVIIETYDDYFQSKKLLVNWDHLFDEAVNREIIPMAELNFKTYRFSYTQDEDLYNKDYFDSFKRIYGDLEIEIDTDVSTNIEKIELKFSPTPVANKFINDRVAPFFVEASEDTFKPKKVKPRILFYGGLVDTLGLYLKDYVDGPSTLLTQYPYTGMWDDRWNPKYDLGFDYTNKIYFSSGQVPTNNLYQKFHRSRLSNIIDPNSKILTGLVKLTALDIAEFDFRNIIVVDNNYWRVNKIEDYDPIDGDSLTKVELIKLNQAYSFDQNVVEVPTSNRWCPADVVGKVPKPGSDIKDQGYYYSLSGQIITDDCCRQLGGYMVNGVCRIGSSTKPTYPSETAAESLADVLGTPPVSDPTGPNIYRQNGNTTNTATTKSQGQNNYGPAYDGINVLSIGKDNSWGRSASNVLILGDEISANDPNTIYFDNIKIDKDGISNIGLVIIDGGVDEVMNIDKTNLIDIVDGGYNAVRNIGGDSKQRPIIDGNPYESNQNLSE